MSNKWHENIIFVLNKKLTNISIAVSQQHIYRILNLIKMKKITTFLFVCVSMSFFGQPVLNSADLNSFNIISNSFTASSSTVNSGAFGANVAWNFSNLVLTSDGPHSFETVSSAPYASNFPTANFFTKVNNEAYGYFTKTSTKMELVGDSFGTTVSPNFTNPETIFVFPFTYNTSVSDTFQESSASPIVNKVIVYDAYGTLNTPFGSFTDCFRIKETAGASNDITYTWYKLNPFRAILSTYTSGNGTTNFDFFQATNLSTNAFQKSEISIYPNPTSGVLNIVLDDKSTFGKIDIFDATGKNIFSQEKFSTTATIDVQDFQPGVYFVSVFVDGNKRTTKFIKQ